MAEALVEVYLAAVLPATLGVRAESLRPEATESASAVGAEEGVSPLVAFAGEQADALFVEVTPDGGVTFSLEVAFAEGRPCAVLFKSNSGALKSDVPLSSQLHFAVLGAQKPFRDTQEPLSASTATSASMDSEEDEKESSVVFEQQTSSDDPASGSFATLTGVYNYVHLALSPLVRSFTTVKTTSGKLQGEEDVLPQVLRQGLPLISKRMNELEYVMRSCLQSMEIPEVKLVIDPVIESALASLNGRNLNDVSLEDLGLGEEVRDAKMLNRLQGGVNRWVKEIQKVTKLDRDASSGTVSQEVQFWVNLERAMQQIQRQVDGPEVRLTLDVLKQSRRALATILFENDTGLQSARKRVSNYMILMQDFPIAALLAATDVPQIEEAIFAIFVHMKKIKSADEYPLTQALKLIQSLSRDMNNQLSSVLATSQLMELPIDDFREIMSQCQSLFKIWDENARSFRELARDLSKRRGSERLPPKIAFEHTSLQERVMEIDAFRGEHYKLASVIEDVVSNSEDDRNQEEELQKQQENGGDDPADEPQSEVPKSVQTMSSREGIKAAHEIVSSIDVLDVSKDGQHAWEDAKRVYEKRIDRVERRIIETLTDRLGGAQSADDMFRVFEKFNALFFRPRIRGAIQQFQTRLIGTVEDDIEALQRTFKKSYSRSQASVMSEVKDVPPVSGAIMWARQIERQLDHYLCRVEAVLGPGWEQHVEGRKLKETGAAFKKKLNTQQMFDQWMKGIQEVPSFEITGRLFRVVENTRSSGAYLRLEVNFDHQIVELFKEVRNLNWLGFRIPYTLKMISDEAKEKYPFAMSLESTLETYTSTMAHLDEEVGLLLSNYMVDVQDHIESSFNKGKVVHWDSDGLRNFTATFSQKVYLLQDKVEDALANCKSVEEQLLLLKSCDYTHQSFLLHLDQIQKIVDEMNLSSYSHLDAWVKNLESRINKILFERATDGIDSWVERFESKSRSESRDEMWHEVVLRKQGLHLDPPLEEARLKWFQSLHSCVGIVDSLPRLKSSRYDSMVGDDRKEQEQTQNASRFPHVLPIEGALEVIGAKLNEVSDYVSVWLQYQALWDLDTEQVLGSVGDQDLSRWIKLLQDVQESRATFDTAEHSKNFGPITVDYQQVQAQISLRYDAWHKELLAKFASILGRLMQNFFDKISKMRMKLEAGSLDASTEQVVAFITDMGEIKSNKQALKSRLEQLAVAERLAQRQRMTFPSDWLWMANLEGEWDAFEQILTRRLNSMDVELPTLQTRIIAEDKAVSERTSQLIQEWSKKKPVAGNLDSKEALSLLAVFQSRQSKVEGEVTRLRRAKEALNLTRADTDPSADPQHASVANLKRETEALQEVWSALGSVSESLAGLREMPWTAVVPKRLRASLDDILENLKKLPSRVRQYEAFEHFQELVRDYKKTQPVIIELRSEALKERHWRQITRILSLEAIPLKEVNLGHLWGADLTKNQKSLSDVFRTAQGEMGLEEFLRQIREHWSNLEFDLVNFQNRCRVIRGWDDLFSQLDEHTNSLLTMKQSPFFRVFEEEAAAWEAKLLRIRVVLDVWIDVQRRWVYLGGILLGSADIKQQLPNEHSRFMSMDNEFVALMRKVAKTPRVLEVLNSIPNLEHILTRLADLLEKIQRALGEYLERQRQGFSRFYFVGDEDLLEVIGNSKDPIKIQRHMSKMFAGISSLMFEGLMDIAKGENGQATEMISREGEMVKFSEPVQLGKDIKVNEWLCRIEAQMQKTLSDLLKIALERNPLSQDSASEMDFAAWLDDFPSQVLILASQVSWSTSVSALLSEDGKALERLETLSMQTQSWLGKLAERVLSGKLSADVRKKHEQLTTEMVHQRDVLRKLAKRGSGDLSTDTYEWLSQIRYRWHEENLSLHIASAEFQYGFEYQGVGERLVQTPLTDRCYLALTQALHFRMGGNPFGPAGTGKTESVKALGTQLGRFVLVFNCDEHFDLQAMGRIFVGLCQVGAWGCFDEFNRLEERILSAVSQQILNIQKGLLEKSHEINLIGRQITLNPNVGIFVTMNPGYAGRSNLPDNLKQLFRGIAMIEPDRGLIAQVMLFSQGFKTAEKLAGRVVLLFKLCSDQLSQQPHYDFGLRAVKSVLLSAGNLKRAGAEEDEQQVLIKSLCENIVPKLVAEDVALYQTLLEGVFPGAKLLEPEFIELRSAVEEVCNQKRLCASERWVSKVMQLEQVQRLRHGIMMVGPSGSGKSTCWQVLLEAMEIVDGVKGVSHVIDPKAMSKDALYGTLDPNTLEWTNGIFTHILRTILNNVRGEKKKRHWIIFDGDVDPEWAENLNSVLDDNKLLTLPNGERLSIPENVRIMFEVETLKYATLATVSRSGMIWYSHGTISVEDVFSHRIKLLEGDQNDGIEVEESKETDNDEGIMRKMSIGKECIACLGAMVESGGLAQAVLEDAMKEDHVMDVTEMRLIVSFFSLLAKGIRIVEDYNLNHQDFPLQKNIQESFITKWAIFSLLWGFGGSMSLTSREAFAEKICKRTTIGLPINHAIWDYSVHLEDGDWHPWKEYVPRVEIEPQKVMDTDEVVTTVDTVRHAHVLEAWLDEHRPLILCGPPGSGKTMSLTNVLQQMPNFELAPLNFSSVTTPDLILKTFEQYCVYKPTRNGLILAPPQPDRWLVVFCDEVNLPAKDSYGTQNVITFMRQVVEQGGFWRQKDLNWVSVERVQFVSACNPPTDPGRVRLPHRFLRHAPLLLVDYPVKDSLLQIYGTFNRALLKLQPSLRCHWEALTEAMVDAYEWNKTQFSPDVAPHYVYSPRELTRWIRALYEALFVADGFSLESLVRLWTHEALRLFHDRLISEKERQRCVDQLEKIAHERFPGADLDSALAKPILFASWLSKNYQSVDQIELRSHVEARLKTFYEEELNVPLVVFDDVLEHVLRIDRVLRQPLGHLLLVGKSGSGKTVLTKFVAWMNGLRVFQIKLSRRYSLADFDDDLRFVMKQAGCHGEKVCFIFDESNVLESAFLERMNALLASGEVPGLYKGDEQAALMSACREAAQQRDANSAFTDADDEEELFKSFTRNVQRNLHVVFTMNPASSDLKNRAATSPALFNRCVVDWFGDWSNQALGQVATEFTKSVDLDFASPDFGCPPEIESVVRESSLVPLEEPLRYRHAVVSCLVRVHQMVQDEAFQQLARHEVHTYVSPRDYLDLIHHFVGLYHKQREKLEDQQLHLNMGLDKLRETALQVEELRESLAAKSTELQETNKRANEKLQLMVSDQKEAETKKSEAEALSKDLDERNAHVNKQRKVSEEELGRAEPALIDAQNAVSNIRKAHLDEMRSLNNPPPAVKMTLEAVCLMLGLSFNSWADIRRILQKREFIPDVVNFKSEDLTEERRANVEAMLQNPDFVEEKVMHANKACVALFRWIVSQLEFAGILLRIQPLREEIAELAEESDKLKVRHQEEMAKVTELEDQIATLKEEYAVLIGETETIKSEMASVKVKVERSKALLDSLSEENERWTASRVNFGEQMKTLPGDVFLAGAYITYAGFFDYKQRQDFMLRWKEMLSEVGLIHRASLSVVDYLSRPSERLKMHAQGLPQDVLCEENAIIMENFNRFPLVIDPSGQASEYLLKRLQERKAVKTSFLDASFMKQLESALRFGTCLIITDVENIDPILNPVLNREIQRTGGRMLVRLGDQEIDFSPSFSMYMTTRDATFQFPPDVCSRVTFVNFTVTPASLEAQCLGRVLRMERPDIEQQREDLLKLQGEFQARLRDLEDQLLESLSETTGNILDDDTVIQNLEKLKTEAADVEKKAAEADEVMEQVQEVSDTFAPFSKTCSQTYFSLVSFADVHYIYQFSLQFFFEILNAVLAAPAREKGAERLQELSASFFAVVYEKTKRTLLEKDTLLFALALCKVAGKEDELSKLLSENIGTDLSEAKIIAEALPSALSGQVDLNALGQVLSSFPNIKAAVKEQVDLFYGSEPESNKDIGLAFTSIERLGLIRALRPDRLLAMVDLYVQASLGGVFVEALRAVPDLQAAVADESSSKHPVLLLSTQGYDMSGRIEYLASERRVRCRSVAMGSSEGFQEAEAAIDAAAQSGGWVMLKNVHLSAQWLQTLQKKLYGMGAPRTDFRLILTSEISKSLPRTLLNQSQKLVFEAPKGMRASLLRSLQSMPEERMNRAPRERSRLYFAVGWLHAIVLERLRFAPLGWSKKYEFSDADQACALDVVDEWVDRVAQGRDHIAPEEIPWKAICSILADSTYGGRIDNEFDLKILEGIISRVLVPKIFDADFALVESGSLIAPEGTCKAHFQAWVEKLPTSNDPSWLGLSDTSETILLRLEGEQLVRKFLGLQAPKEVEERDSTWLQAVEVVVGTWEEGVKDAESVAAKIRKGLERTEELVTNSLFRCFEREAHVILEVLRMLQDDCEAMRSVLKGEHRMTNDLQLLSESILKKAVPPPWQSFLQAANLDVWMQDFLDRVEEFERLLDKETFDLPLQLNFGMLFLPGAFITATRQHVAKGKNLSLEDLALVGSVDGYLENAHFQTEITVEGAQVLQAKQGSSDTISSRTLVQCFFTWLENDEADSMHGVRLPLYASTTREHLLAEVNFVGKFDTDPNKLILRGCAIIAHP